MAKNPVGRPRKASPTFNHPTRSYSPPPPADLEYKPNFDLLSAEEKAGIIDRAKAKVEAKERDRAMEAFLEAEVERLERELHPEAHEEEKEITIDLAVYADRIIINGRHYMHGRRYTVKKSLFDAMQDIMARTHKHYADTHRDPARALMEAQQAVAKGGSSYKTISANSGAQSF